MTKNEVISALISIKPDNLNLIKASTKSGGGLLKVNNDNSFSKIMLRRSKNYLYEDISDEARIRFDVLSWFRISEYVIKEFEYILFVITDDNNQKVYPFIFKVTDFQKLLNQEGANGDNISIYIQKIRDKNEFLITRLGKELKNEIDVTTSYLNWNILYS